MRIQSILRGILTLTIIFSGVLPFSLMAAEKQWPSVDLLNNAIALDHYLHSPVRGAVSEFFNSTESDGQSEPQKVKALTTALENAALVQGEIKYSFYASAKHIGLSPVIATAFTDIFQWQLDFSREVQAGDRFEILLHGEQILAAQFHQRQRTLTALLHDDGLYYTPAGTLLERPFLSRPLERNYPVSSGFDLHRVHPVLGEVRAHRGTDWAVPEGTPVLTTADGMVVKSVANHPAAGNYIEIRHGGRYMTRYLHLGQLHVKAGQQVRRGDVIALSGNSGLSTGPHLHYELHVNNVAVDVMKTRLGVQRPLTGTERMYFQQNLVAVMSKLGVDQALATARSTHQSDAS